MYCARCGVLLAESEKACPLCHLPAYHPDLPNQQGKPTYPAVAKPTTQQARRTSGAILLTTLFSIVLLFTLVCNLSLSKNVSWWKYVAISLTLLYLVWVLPMWFSRVPTVFWAAVNAVCVGGYLALLNLFMQDDWFLSFAFPVLGWVCLVGFSAYILIHFWPGSWLYVVGIEAIATSAFMLLFEFLLDYTFSHPIGFSWSLYALTGGALFGITVLLTAFFPPLRRALYKKIFW